MKKLFFLLSFFISEASFSKTSFEVENYFYDIIFLNALPLAGEAVEFCNDKSKYVDDDLLFCEVFSKLDGKKISLMFSENELKKTSKEDKTVFSSYSEEDFSFHNTKVYTRGGESFDATIDTSSFMSIADISPNLVDSIFHFKDPFGQKITASLAIVDMNSNVSGMRNKIIITQEGRSSGVLGVDFIGQYGQFSFYSDGIWIQPENIICTHKCISYDADFDGENLHFYYPFNDETKRRVSFETGSSISTVPFSVKESCVSEKVDFSELEERGLDVGDDARLCKKEFKFGDYSMHSSVVTHASREIDGEPLPVMGMNMINAFDHVTVDLPAGKIYFYFP
ncbi:hypothetical protein [Marinomonas ostreistagni]|uniref:Uncharacterized protein n=1 Tax=Marinomonas ostreistagni TaxID=359209 RepID=A0ABS0ZDG0_9GAMM|nr:hypothetical protein [Marinomonas ostreistagni]MBJ7551713.1 hypothetical protein [Marinomonas ostreistagni]